MTKFKRPVSVQSEALSFTMAGEDSVYLSHQEDLLDNFEELFPYYSCREIKQDFLCTLPILFRKASGKLVAFSESDLRDYGGLEFENLSLKRLDLQWVYHERGKTRQNFGGFGKPRFHGTL